MVISQRNGTSTVTPASTDYLTDRWSVAMSQSSKFTGAQSTLAPTGFNNSLLITSSSAYSVGASDYFVLRQAIEGFNFADCGFGTADAKTVTVSFWVRSNLTGSFGGALYNATGTRSYPFTYTISAANTWEQKSVTITGDTSGTWVGATNGIGVYVSFSLGAGSSFNSTANAWATGFYTQSSGATSVVGTSGATFYITGVQLEVGTQATTFDYRSYGTEFALCQRYYTVFAKGSDIYLSNAYYYGTSSVYATMPLPVAMRTTPTSAVSSGTNYYTMYAVGAGDGFNSLSVVYASNQVVTFNNASEVSGTSGQSGGIYTAVANSFVAVQAEL
jgi:hypothetical protein